MKRLAFLLVLTLASTAGAVNDFSFESDLVALWKFEAGANFRLDSSGNGNHFSASGQMGEGGTTAWNTTDYQEGTASVDFESANNNFFSILDATLTAGFPGKSGTTNNVWSVCCWVNLESLPADGAPDWGNRTIVNKGAAGTYSWAARCSLSGVNTRQEMYIGITNGTAVEEKFNTAINLASGTWYHMFWSFNGATKAYQMQVKTTGGTVYRTSGSTTNSQAALEGAVFEIGRTGAKIAEMDGLWDHLVIFNDVLSYTEANSVADDTYDCAGDAACVAEYSFELAGMGLDSSGTGNDLVVPVSNTVTYAEGASSCYCNGTYTTGMDILDADLSAGFPGKSGGDNNDVYTVLCWFQFDSQPAAYQSLAGKWWNTSTPTNSSWVLGTNLTATRAAGNWSDGTTLEGVAPVRNLTTGVWYHIATIIDPSTDRAYTRLYDSSNTTVYTGEDLTAPTTMQVTTDSFRVGAGINPSAVGGTLYAPFFGYLDELVIIHRTLTDDEIDAIRDGTYAPGVDTNNWWWRRRHSNLMQWDSWRIVLPDVRRVAA